MKIRKLGNIIFFAITLIVFGAGTVFTCIHRWDVNANIFSRANILAIAGAMFLTVGELAFIFIHALLNSRDLWRRCAAYVLSLGLAGTITYAACSEAMAFMSEGNISTKAHIISDFGKEQQTAARSKRAETMAVIQSQKTLQETLKDFSAPSFAPFAVNFFFGLFVLLTGTLIQPGEAWKRKRGNVMNEDIRAVAENQLGRPLPHGATAYDDGKASSVKVQKGRDYLTTVSKRKIGFK
jgi:hypothetical protein